MREEETERFRQRKKEIDIKGEESREREKESMRKREKMREKKKAMKPNELNSRMVCTKWNSDKHGTYPSY
jgi:hypothetical protein